MQRADWDYSEHLTVPNPDYRAVKRIATTEENIRIYHTDKQKMEDAGWPGPTTCVPRRGR
ncbi:MAG: hypothetical protein JWQ93_1137 [Marmoricola sp.]|nr:hypothetical protein [Marmoricola sp.]